MWRDHKYLGEMAKISDVLEPVEGARHDTILGLKYNPPTDDYRFSIESIDGHLIVELCMSAEQVGDLFVRHSAGANMWIRRYPFGVDGKVLAVLMDTSKSGNNK